MIDFDNNDLGMIVLSVLGVVGVSCMIYGKIKGLADLQDINTFGLAIAGMIGSLAGNKKKEA